MDAQDFRSLQEAYMEVVENQQQLDEANRGDEYVTSSMYMSREPETTAAKVRRRQKRDGLPDNASHEGDDKDYDRQYAHKVERGRKKLKAKSDETLEGPNKDVKRAPGKYAGMQRRKRQGLSYREEQVDLYDIILLHLLDEGYAETPEAAEAIMVNMSEEWREEIVDEAVEIMSVTSPEGKSRSGSRIYSGKASQMRQNARKLSNLQKRQRLNPEAQSTKSARRQTDQEFRSSAKKSIKNLNVDPNSEVKYGSDKVDREGYREVPTDYRARRRRASGR